MSFSLLLVFLLASFLTADAQYCTNYHIVRAGDTCYQIAFSRGFDLNALLQVNPGVNCYNLQIGQPLCLPTFGNNIYNPYGYPYYPYGYPYFPNQNIITPPIINNNNNLNQITTQPGTCLATYTIKSGDICYSIAQYAGLQLYYLYTYNPGLNCDLLQIGQQICVNRR